MIFCENLLFLHVPKTGGMSITELLLAACPRPTYCTHPATEPKWALPGVHEVDGARHETLEEAVPIVRQFGFELTSFNTILSVIRNPYEIEVSRFGYYRKGNPSDAGNKGRDYALAGDFRSFALTAEPHGGAERSIERYFLLEGAQPKNLRIARYEHLVADVSTLLEEEGISLQGLQLPHLNASIHENWRTYYDAQTEAAVFSRYRWAFEAGLYPRLEVAGNPNG